MNQFEAKVSKSLLFSMKILSKELLNWFPEIVLRLVFCMTNAKKLLFTYEKGSKSESVTFFPTQNFDELFGFCDCRHWHSPLRPNCWHVDSHSIKLSPMAYKASKTFNKNWLVLIIFANINLYSMKLSSFKIVLLSIILIWK